MHCFNTTQGKHISLHCGSRQISGSHYSLREKHFRGTTVETSFILTLGLCFHSRSQRHFVQRGLSVWPYPLSAEAKCEQQKILHLWIRMIHFWLQMNVCQSMHAAEKMMLSGWCEKTRFSERKSLNGESVMTYFVSLTSRCRQCHSCLELHLSPRRWSRPQGHKGNFLSLSLCCAIVRLCDRLQSESVKPQRLSQQLDRAITTVFKPVANHDFNVRNLHFPSARFTMNTNKRVCLKL